MKINALQYFLAMNPIIQALPSNGQNSHHRSATAAGSLEYGRADYPISYSMSMMIDGSFPELNEFVVVDGVQGEASIIKVSHERFVDFILFPKSDLNASIIYKA